MGTRSTDETAIRAMIEDWLAALRAKRADGVVGYGVDDFVAFTLAPPLITPTEGTDGLQAWFDTWDGPLDLEIRDLKIAASGDVAFCHFLSHMAGTLKSGARPDLWFRQTLGLRRIGGDWKIAHQHESVPFYMDGSFKAAIDLKP
jgi:PhnB protein